MIYTKQLQRYHGGPYCLDTKEEYPPNFLCAGVTVSIIPCKLSELPLRLNFQVSTEFIPDWHEGILINSDPEATLFPCFDVLFDGKQHGIFLGLQNFLVEECGLKDQDHFWFRATPVKPMKTLAFYLRVLSAFGMKGAWFGWRWHHNVKLYSRLSGH